MSYAWGINNNAEVVGASSSASGTEAFLWTSSGGMQSLTDLIDPTSGWLLRNAKSINDSGQIVGFGTIGGADHAFLLTPVPEPMSLLLYGAGLLGLAGLRKKNKE